MVFWGQRRDSQDGIRPSQGGGINQESIDAVRLATNEIYLALERRCVGGTATPIDRVLIVHEDDPLWLCETLQSFGFSVQTVRHGGTALDCLAQLKRIVGVLLDVRARTADDRPLLPALRHRYPQMPIMTMAGRQDIDLLRASIGLGAYEYLVTPTHDDMLKIKCARVFVHQVRADSVQPMDGQIDRAGPATTG